MDRTHHSKSLKGRIGCAVILLSAAVLGHAAEPDHAILPGSIDGTWRWSFTMPDGATSRPTLNLETEDGKLAGTNSFRPGSEIAITNALLSGDQIQFQVIRQRDGREIVTRYSGTWSGRFIHGKVESNWAGQPQSYNWDAERAHDGAEGVWKWMTSVRGRKVEARVKLEQDGDLLTGYVPGTGRGLRRLHIRNGSVQNGEIHFEIERGAGENKVLTVYQGKQSGDTIKGTVEIIRAGKKSEVPWEATRPD
jgi:hypothetical protein